MHEPYVPTETMDRATRAVERIQSLAAIAERLQHATDDELDAVETDLAAHRVEYRDDDEC